MARSNAPGEQTRYDILNVILRLRRELSRTLVEG